MSSPFIGQLALVPYNFAPRGWAFCDGQIMSIAQNTALFSLLGTFYGGNGQSTFALPNLQGSIAIGVGQGPGLSNYDLGQTGGTDTVTLQITEIPNHNHSVNVAGGRPSAGTDPTNEVFGTAASPGTPYGPSNSSLNLQLLSTALIPAGQNLPHENKAPYLVLSWIIALQGVFPSRA